MTIIIIIITSSLQVIDARNLSYYLRLFSQLENIPENPSVFVKYSPVWTKTKQIIDESRESHWKNWQRPIFHSPRHRGHLPDLQYSSANHPHAWDSHHWYAKVLHFWEQDWCWLPRVESHHWEDERHSLDPQPFPQLCCLLCCQSKVQVKEKIFEKSSISMAWSRLTSPLLFLINL